MERKKVLIGVILVVILAVGIITTFVIIGNKEKEEAKKLVSDYFDLVNNKSYEEMYSKTANMNMSKEDFITRNQNIYEGIDSSNITVQIKDVKKEEGIYNVSYHEKMYTSAGEVEFDYSTDIVKENGEFKIKWTSHMIFPQLSETDKVRVTTIKARRGSILDRNSIPLAEDGSISSVGIVPGKLRRK